ncbi:peptidylprolyl isomerase [Nostoc sp. CENA543]|uniref:peptidylprolyl isomerase n=1 Tax=Nostoc sp. CENA543 TaxID=1869241 RepID=UPI001863E6DD|nr:peptidylprolyl isomerase [Nostoc sp. CENA543]
MSQIITIPQQINLNKEDFIEQIKLSCKVPSLVEEITVRKIVENTAAKLGIQVDTEELQQTADKIRLTNKLSSAAQTWTWLEKHGLSLDDFEKVAHLSLLSAKLAEHLFADKVEPYFFEHQNDYTSAIAYEVILDDEDLAIELFYAIQEGEISFYDVAHKYIQDEELRRRGGYQGVLKRQDLKPEISAAIFASQPPQLLKPIFTSKGAHLILVEQIIVPQLDTKLRNLLTLELFSHWLKIQVESVTVTFDLQDSQSL